MQFTKGLGKNSEEVLLVLRQELEQGVYPLHARFPSAAELCKRFGFSRNTILRALERLSSEGFIETRQGAGSFVLRTGTPPRHSRTLAAMLTFDSDNLITAQNRALERGFLMCVYSRNVEGWAPGPERLFLERVRAERHMSLLAWLTPTKPTNEDLLRQMEADGTRILHLEPYEMQPPEQNYLIPDYLRAGQLAASKVIIDGFKHLVFAGTAMDWPGAKIFRKGFEEAIAELADSKDTTYTYFEFPTGYDFVPHRLKRLQKFLRDCKKGTAIACRDPGFAKIIHDGLSERGMKQGVDFLTLPVCFLGMSSDQCPFPCIDFDYTALIERAIDLLTGEDWPRVQEFIKPILIPANKDKNDQPAK